MNYGLVQGSMPDRVTRETLESVVFKTVKHLEKLESRLCTLLKPLRK
jgi:hypothetical protein